MAAECQTGRGDDFSARRSCASRRRVDEFWDGSVAGAGTSEFVALRIVSKRWYFGTTKKLNHEETSDVARSFGRESR